MKENKNSEILVIAGIIGCVLFYFLLRDTFPKFATILLIFGVTLIAGIVMIVAFAMYMALKKTPEKEGEPSEQEFFALQKEGRASLIELRKIGMNIKNQTIRKENEKICEIAGKIIRELKNHKENLSSVRGFFKYYLPTLSKILKNYKKLEEEAVVATEITQSTIKCMDEIKKAMEKQYENLFEKYVLDMTVEMEALMSTCKRDGLILEDEESEEKITLMF